MKRISLVFMCCFLISFLGCGASTSSSGRPNTISVEDAIKQANSTPKRVKESGTSLEYVGCEVVENKFLGTIVSIYFDFENTSNENKIFAYTYTVKAFQDGVEMDREILFDDKYDDNSIKEIQPGAKIRVSVSFEYEDEKPIILEVCPWISLNNEILMKMEVTPK